jgi:tetratricopeptide (TPR) repeat protein/predicted Ser/Thr protein kinase
VPDNKQPPFADPDRPKSDITKDAVTSDPFATIISSDDQTTLAPGSLTPPRYFTEPQLSDTTAHYRVGAVVAGRYQILRVLGEGGMGTVYMATDRELNRTVALKTVRQEYASNPALIQRFKQELILAREVTHRNVVRIFDLGEAEGVKFITMEYVDGEPLVDVLHRRGRFPPKEAADIIEKVCLALEAAHAEGVVHRDLKPANIMQDKQGRIVVMDFGLAHSVQLSSADLGPVEAPSVNFEMDSSYRSMPGSLVGTPRYMSPEQALCDEVDARSDIYALGLIFYELLTGQIPFKSSQPMEALLKRTQEDAPALIVVDPQIPRALSYVVAKCLQRERKLRYQSVADLLADLNRWRKPVRRGWVYAAAGTGILLIVGVQLLVQRKAEPAQHAPLSILVADFKNNTGDSVFNGTLEPALGTALEGASFITDFDRGQAHKIAAELQPGAATLDEQLARLVATRENINVVVNGSVSPKRNAYDIQVRAIDPTNGKVLVTANDTADKKDVLRTLGKLAAPIRSVLGDKTPESVQVSAAETFSTDSLEAAHEYSEAGAADFAGKLDEAIQHGLKAVELDPNLGRAYAIVAIQYYNMGQTQQAEKYFKLALSKIDHMSEREKYRTRGAYYLATNEIDKAQEEFSQLVKLYPADSAGHANLAAAYFFHRDMSHAVEEARKTLTMYPKDVVTRSNMALYDMYAGDFAGGIEEANNTLEMNPSFAKGYEALALSQLGLGHPQEASAAYERLAKVKPQGNSPAAIGEADLALYEGRPSDAVKILERAVRDDLAAKNPDGAAKKLVMLGGAYLMAHNEAQALGAADQAVKQSKDFGIEYLAARVYLGANKPQKALALAKDLGNQLEGDPEAYGKLIEAEAELGAGKAREALDLINDSRKFADTWMGRYDAALAYSRAERYAEADSELEICVKRRGEATALFLDESPTYYMFPPVYYYLGRTQEGLGSPAAADSYKTFLVIKTKGSDPLVADARRRLGSHQP